MLKKMATKKTQRTRMKRDFERLMGEVKRLRQNLMDLTPVTRDTLGDCGDHRNGRGRFGRAASRGGLETFALRLLSCNSNHRCG